jgi:hypothetical protein
MCVALTLWTRIRLVLSSNLGWNTRNPEIILGFPQPLQQLLGWYLGYTRAASFEIITNSLFANHPILRRDIFYTSRVTKLTENRSLIW